MFFETFFNGDVSYDEFNSLICFIAIFILLIFLTFFKKRFVSSENKWIHSFGMVYCAKDVLLLFTMLFVLRYVMPLLVDNSYYDKFRNFLTVLVIFVFVLVELRAFIKVFKFDSRHQKDSYNHALKTIMLCSFGLMLVYVMVVFKIDSESFLPFGLCATVLGLLFKDSIIGIVTYYQLRSGGLLHIGDWIEVPEKGIDGIITDISLVNVTIMNWDNTKSNVAISLLKTESFKNYQDMVEGKTTGRRIFCKFIIDSDCIEEMTPEKIEVLRNNLIERGEDTISLDYSTKNKKNMLNVYLFRMYLSHWLMNHVELTRYPYLLVYLSEPTPDGLPLHIFTFATKSTYVYFESTKSMVIEHIIMAMDWFGLRLYQKPSMDDMSINNFTVNEDLL